MTAALALAFSAGMVATLNPCGFAMLPAYLSFFMGIKEEHRSRGAVMRSALRVGVIVSFGFLLVFGIAGIIITGVSRSVATQWIPWLALVVGVGIGVLGVALLLGYELRVGLPEPGRGTKDRGYRSVVSFGVSYAVASLSCTLPVFLTVVATQITQRSFASGIFDLPGVCRRHGRGAARYHHRARARQAVPRWHAQGFRQPHQSDLRGHSRRRGCMDRLVLVHCPRQRGWGAWCLG